MSSRTPPRARVPDSGTSPERTNALDLSLPPDPPAPAAVSERFGARSDARACSSECRRSCRGRVRSEVGQLFGGRVASGRRGESRAKRKNNHRAAFWAFSTFVRYASRSFRQFSVTEKAFARKKNRERKTARFGTSVRAGVLDASTALRDTATPWVFGFAVDRRGWGRGSGAPRRRRREWGKPRRVPR